MGACRFVALITAASVLLLAFYLYSPVPAGLANPWLTRTYIAALRCANLISHTVQMSTGISATNVLRYQIETLYKPIFRSNHELVVQDMRFDGIPVRIYRPQSSVSPSPCIVYFHGGSWSLFTIDSYDHVTSKLSLGTNTVVIAVNFRHAPENPYPIPFDDCVKATRYILHNFQAYDIDVSRVAVAGDGSGANLAAAVALRLSEEDPEHTPPLKLQVLIQPALQAFNFDTPSYRQNSDDSLMTRLEMIKFWCHYIGIEATLEVLESFQENKHISPSVRKSIYSTYFTENRLPENTKKNYIESSLDSFSFDYHRSIAEIVESKVIDPFISPLLAEDLSKLPPVYILIAEYDIIRDDGLFYASRLIDANVSVTINYISNQTHGFLAPMLDLQFLLFDDSDKVWHEVYTFLKFSL